MLRTAVSLLVITAMAIAMPSAASAALPGDVVSVTVSAAPSPALAKGGTHQFTATAHFGDGSTADVTDSSLWSSSNQSVAFVDTTGLATGFTQGISFVTAEYGGTTSAPAELRVSNCTWIGTPGPDVHTGTSEADFLCGMGGDDDLDGAGGNDIVEGGDGNDTLSGGDGLDKLYGQNDVDTIDGGADADSISTGAGDDTATGDGGADRLWGGDGNDTLSGGLGDDFVTGNDGADNLLGDDGSDRIYPGGGDDPQVDGGTGNDTVDYEDVAGPVVVDLSTGVLEASGAGTDALISIENANGSPGDDTLTAAEAGSTLAGRQGIDNLIGNIGNDLLKGQAGDDSLGGGGGADFAYGDDGIDVISGDAGVDTIRGGDGDDSLGGGDDNDVLYGEAGIDTLLGGNHDDRLAPGTGTGQYVDGQLGSDTITADGIGEGVEINLGGTNMNWTAGSVEIAGVENATGTAFADIITGDGGANVLQGMGDGDVLAGLGASDTIHGGGGGDTADGGLGDDKLYGDDGDDNLAGAQDNDLIHGGGGDDTSLDGGTGTDIILGQAGGDTLTGGDGDDALNPGLGNDTVDGGTGSNDALLYTSEIVSAITVDIDAGTSTGGAGNDAFSGIESAGGTLGDDTIFGDENANRLSGGAGADTINGRGGVDVIFGGTGNDSLRGGIGDIDTINGQADTDTCGEAADVRTSCELAFNEPPVLTIVDNTNTYIEDQPATAVDSTLTLTDDETNTDGATVTIDSGYESGKDILSVTEALPAGVTASYVAPTLTISGVASVAQYQAILRSVRFQNTSQDPSLAARSILFSVTDGEFTDAGNEVFMAVERVNDPPVADADSFGGGQQGIRLRVGTTHADKHEVELTGDVLNGDTDVDTPVANLTVTPGTIATADGGTVVMASDGSFTYDPPAGDDGTDSFQYTVEDNDTGDSDASEDTHQATVTITQAGPRVWFVDDTAPAGGRGVSHAPLQSLAPLSTGGVHDAKDGTNDRIFVYEGTYTNGIALETGQHLLGQPQGLNVGGTIFVDAGGSAPAISHAGASVVTLGSDNELQNLALGDGATSLAGGSIGTATIDDTSIANTAGRAIDITGGGTLNAAFDSVSSSNSPGVGVGLTGLSGTIALGSGALQNATGTVFHVSGGNAAITYGGTITDTNGRLVNVDGTTGGSRTFNGAVSDTTDNDNGSTGVRINSAAGPNSFAGGLKLSTGADHALEINSSTGTTTVPSNTVNTLKSTSGYALKVFNSPLAGTFQRIDSSGGNANAGIHLDGLNGGGVTVTGSGTPGSGGTIASKSGADGDDGGHGVHLANVTAPVSLSRMQLNDFGNFAIRGTAVSGEFDLIDSNISGVSGNSTITDEAAIAFSQLTGTGHQILRTNVSGGYEDNIQVRNSSGTLNRLNITGPATVGAHGSNEGNDSIGMTANGTASFNATVENMTVTHSRGDIIGYNASGTANSDLVLTGNTLHNALPQASIAGAGGGNTITVDQSADLTYSITNNSMRNSKGTMLLVHKGFGGVSGDGTMRGTIQGNTIGQSGFANSSSTEGSGIQVSLGTKGLHTAVIRNNNVFGYANHGIALLAQGFGTSGTGLNVHDGDLNATVKGNTVGSPSAPAGGLAQNGIHLNSGSNGSPDVPDAYDICVDIGSATVAADRNVLTGSGALGGTEIRVRQRFGADILMPGYSGGLTDTTAVRNYLEARQTMTAGSSSASYQGPGGGYANTGSCPTP